MASKRFLSSKRFRLTISLALVFHLLAVFLPPMSFQTRGPLGQSPSIATALQPVESYGEFLYINRGYAFFAPDPGPSHLIQAAITDSQGGRKEVMIPDRTRQWPRLLYHRHFMLTEFLYEIYQPPLPVEEVAAMSEEEARYWRQSRSRYEHFRQSLVEHIESVNPGSDVAIRRIEHLIPDLTEFRQRPVSLTDPDSYRVLLDQPPDFGMFPRGDGEEVLPDTSPSPSGAAALRRAALATSQAESTGIPTVPSSSGMIRSIPPDAVDSGAETPDEDRTELSDVESSEVAP